MARSKTTKRVKVAKTAAPRRKVGRPSTKQVLEQQNVKLLAAIREAVQAEVAPVLTRLDEAKIAREKSDQQLRHVIDQFETLGTALGGEEFGKTLAAAFAPLRAILGDVPGETEPGQMSDAAQAVVDGQQTLQLIDGGAEQASETQPEA